MYDNLIQEARRQVEICNACRYCEGYCSVFPTITSARAFSDGDITHLANLCHNCRGCYYACQYTEPHEFDLNLPKALAEVRHESWKQHAWPAGFSALFDRAGVFIAGLCVLITTVLFYAIAYFDLGRGDGFYAYISHSVLVAIFAPVFLLPLIALGISLRSYWRATGAGAIRMLDIRAAFGSAAQMKNLKGGHGDGCNFEAEDAFTPWRRWFHHFTLYGFLLCFASTSSGTVLHYVFDIQEFRSTESLGWRNGLFGVVIWGQRDWACALCRDRIQCCVSYTALAFGIGLCVIYPHTLFKNGARILSVGRPHP